MTTDEVRAKVETIRKMAEGQIKVASDGYPHSREDSLWLETLRAIAGVPPNRNGWQRKRSKRRKLVSIDSTTDTSIHARSS